MRSIRQRINDWINSFSDDLEITPIPDDTQVPRTTGDIARFDRRAWERVNARLHRGRLEITEARQFGTAQQIAPDELNRENPVGWGRTLAEAYDVFLQGTNNPPITTTPMAQRMTNEKWLVNEAKDILAQHGNPEIFYTDFGAENETVVDFGINLMNATTGANYANYWDPNERSRYSSYTGVRDLCTFNLQLRLPGTRTTTIEYEGTTRLIAVDEQALLRANFHLIQAPAERISTGGRNYRTNDDGKITIAMVHKNVIHLYLKLDERTAANKAILKYILKEALPLISAETYPRKRPENYKKYQIIKAITAFEKERTANLERNIAELERNIEHNLAEYIDYSKRKATSVQQLSLARSTQNVSQEKTEKFIAYLEKHKKVKEYDFEGNLFKIVFTGLKNSFKGDVVEMPDFTIRLNLSRGNFTGKVENDVYKDVMYPHPHIYDDGRFCLGNFTSIYAKIAASGELVQAIELIMQFLESYNDDSPTNRWFMFRYDMKHKVTCQRNSRLADTAAEEWQEYLKKTSQNENSDDDDDEEVEED